MDGFLKAHGVFLDLTLDDVRHGRRLFQMNEAEVKAVMKEIFESLVKENP